MSKVRSLKFNLKDLNNELALNIISGLVDPVDFVKKDASEFASEA
jgi:hypothetical protein